MAKPLLTIGMIVKNEIRCIERCLKALQPLREAVPCEVIVADTGSEDGTREVAEKYADLVFDFPWINDFAAARNAVMERSSGSWYLSLDADETLDRNVEELKAFLYSPQAKECTSAYLMINNYTDPTDDGQFTVFEANRLLNMATGLRFEGKIHETWPVIALKQYIYLRNTVLWHDGYINNGLLTENKKGRRNMSLIEEQLAKEPDNLLYLMQATESAYTNEQAVRYVRRMMDQLKKEGVEGNILGPAAYRDALRVGGEMGMPEYQEWLEEALAAYPDSLYVQIDVNYMAAITAQKNHDYAGVLKYGQAYLHGMERMEKKDLGTDGLRCGTIASGSKVNYEGVILAMSMAHARRREWEDCLHLLEEHPVETMSPGSVEKWLNVAYFSWEYIDLTQLFVNAGKALFAQAPEEDGKRKLCRDIFIARTNEMFFYVQPTDLEPEEFYPEKPAFPLVVALGNCDLAHAARVMLAEGLEAVCTAAEYISDWGNIPILVHLKLLSLHLPMPWRFFEISAEKIANYAGMLASNVTDQMMDLLPEREGCTPMEQLWNYDLCIGAVKYADWGNEKVQEKLMALTRRFLQESSQFLSWFYNPNILNQDFVCVLPGMHHFAWCCCQAEQSLKQGNELGYVRSLRAGLEAAPGMKGMVDFLLQQLERQQANASPELIDLANKVREILAQYAPDDPAVQALKQSEAYRRVAHLIEGVKAPVFGDLPQ